MLLFYAFSACFSALNTFSGLSGNVLMRAPVALKMRWRWRPSVGRRRFRRRSVESGRISVYELRLRKANVKSKDATPIP